MCNMPVLSLNFINFKLFSDLSVRLILLCPYPSRCTADVATVPSSDTFHPLAGKNPRRSHPNREICGLFSHETTRSPVSTPPG